MIRVLYVSATDRFGGAEASLYTLLAALDRDTVEPLLVCPEPDDETGGFERLSDLAGSIDVPVERLPLKRLKRTFCPLELRRLRAHCLALRGRIGAFAQERGIDLIHANSVAAALQAGGAPLVCHARDLSFPRLAGWDLSKRVRAVVATSQAVAAVARRRVGSLTRCIANGVDTERFRPGREGVPEEDPYLLMIGNLVPWKRHRLFLECLAEVRARAPFVRGVIAGDDLFGEHRRHVEDLRALAEDLGLAYALDWCEGVRFADMPSLIAGASVLVHPTEREPFGRAVIEAMACATPVVAADAAGPRELLVHGGGVLVQPGDALAMAAAAAKYLNQPGLAREHGRLGRTAAVEHYAAALSARAAETLYREVLPV